MLYAVTRGWVEYLIETDTPAKALEAFHQAWGDGGTVSIANEKQKQTHKDFQSPNWPF